MISAERSNTAERLDAPWDNPTTVPAFAVVAPACGPLVA